MKRTAWNMTGVGLLATVTVLIEIIYIILQTEPTIFDTGIMAVSTVLSMTGAVFFAGAFWEWKQKISRPLAFVLIAIGLVGVSGIFVFYIALVGVFFPKLSIISFLVIDFTAVAMVGVFLSIFSRLPMSNDE
ncbi:MAG: hypothetical protein E4H14_11890 [Candidatus Thorarchaeota archaeon]|nr:MAG: hypothetical protein E4H14_11890 [Candidatus Thorarchaeota archaeon]